MESNSMAASTVGLDEFLSSQAQSSQEFKATIEAIEGDQGMVKITPWIEGVGCACHLAITLPKTSIESLTPTDDFHRCCGKRFRVVEVHFKKGDSIALEPLFAQLSRAATPSEHSHDRPDRMDSFVDDSEESPSRHGYPAVAARRLTDGKLARCLD